MYSTGSSFAGSAAIFIACAAEQAATHPSAGDSGVADAIGVLDAKAGPTPPSTTVDVVPCVGGIAEKAYPGRSKEDLARATAMFCVADGATANAPPGYNCSVAAVWVKDGAIALRCGSVSSVTLTVPPAL